MINEEKRDYGQPDPNPPHHFYVDNEKENPIQNQSQNEKDEKQLSDPHHSPEDERDSNSQDLHPNQDNVTTTGDSSVDAGTNPDRYSKEAYNPASDGIEKDGTSKKENKDYDSPPYKTPGL